MQMNRRQMRALAIVAPGPVDLEQPDPLCQTVVATPADDNDRERSGIAHIVVSPMGNVSIVHTWPKRTHIPYERLLANAREAEAEVEAGVA